MRRVLVALLVALVVPAAALGAAPQLVAQGAGGFWGADGRYALYGFTDALHVIDTRSGARFDVTAPDQCAFVDVGGGYALWDCHTFFSLRLLNLATGSVRSIPSTGMYGADPKAIGRHWVYGITPDREQTPIYLNWQTREIDAPGQPRKPVSVFTNRLVVADLDYRDLARPLCKPLVRARYEVPQYERPYLVGGISGGPEIRRCGSRRRRSFHGTGDVVLRNGVVTWLDGYRVRARILRTGRSFAWNWRPLDPSAHYASVDHTANTVFIATVNDSGGRLFSVRLP